MHALFQHYDTAKVHEQLPLRLRIPVSPTPPLSWSPRSSLSSSPPNTPPLSPVSTDDDVEEFIPSDELEYPTYEQCYRTFSKSLSSCTPPAPAPEPISIACSPMSSAPTSRSSSPCPLPSSRRTRNQNQLRKRSKKTVKQSLSPPMTSEPAYPILGSAKGRSKISTKSKKGFGHGLGIGASKTQAQEKTSPVSGNGRRKNFVCPTKGCTKSYLNPNGLKYHLEKGTCDIRTEFEDEAMMEENVQPASVVVDEEEVTQSESDPQIQAHVPPTFSPPDSAPSSPQRSREHSLFHQIQLQPCPQSQHTSQTQYQQTSSWYPDYADSDSESLSDIDTQSVVESHMDVDAHVPDLDVVGESE